MKEFNLSHEFAGFLTKNGIDYNKVEPEQLRLLKLAYFSGAGTTVLAVDAITRFPLKKDKTIAFKKLNNQIAEYLLSQQVAKNLQEQRPELN